MSVNQKMNLHQKLNQIMKEIQGIKKDKTIEVSQNRSYDVVTHDNVSSLLHKPFADIGILAIPDMENVEIEILEKEKEYSGKLQKSNEYLAKVWCSLEFINVDEPTQSIKTRTFAYAFDSSDKATGKAYSMAIKYAYLKTLMLESYDDEESREVDHGKTNFKQSSYQKNERPGKTMLENGPSPSQVSYLKTLIDQKKYKEPVDWNGMTMDSAKALIGKLIAIKI